MKSSICARTWRHSTTRGSEGPWHWQSTGRHLSNRSSATRPRSATTIPFASLFASTDKSVPQRVQDIPAAKALMAEAGVADGFSVDLFAQKAGVIPEVAVLLQDQLKEIGITVNVVQMGTDQYYGDLKFGTSPMLDSAFGIDDYGHRGVPNVFLSAQLSSTGPWNSSHFKNPTYDALKDAYFLATDLKVQQEKAGEIQRPSAGGNAATEPLFLQRQHGALASGDRCAANGHGTSFPRRSRVCRMSPWTRALLRRGGLSLLSLVLLSLIIFFVIQVMPGDVGRRILGSLADQRSVDKLNEALGVNRPAIIQYLDWAGNFVRGNFGTSLRLPGARRSIGHAGVRQFSSAGSPRHRGCLAAQHPHGIARGAQRQDLDRRSHNGIQRRRNGDPRIRRGRCSADHLRGDAGNIPDIGGCPNRQCVAGKTLGAGSACDKRSHSRLAATLRGSCAHALEKSIFPTTFVLPERLAPARPTSSVRTCLQTALCPPFPLSRHRSAT